MAIAPPDSAGRGHPGSNEVGPKDVAAIEPGGRPRRAFIQMLSEGQRPPPAPLPVPTAAAVAVASPGALPLDLRRFADQALRAERTVDALITAASQGKTFTAAELIALQATVFRYSQTVELLSRATDRLIGSVKQALGTQV